MRPRVKQAILALAVCAGAVVAAPGVRQTRLNRQLLNDIQAHAGVSAIRGLLRQGADPNASEGFDSALFLAIQDGSSGEVQALLDAGASTRPFSEASAGPASFAAAAYIPGTQPRSVAEYRAIFEDLRGHGESLEERDSLGFTPLMRAVWAGNVNATQTLLDMGANVHARDNRGDAVMDWSGSQPTEQAALERLLHGHEAAPLPHGTATR